MKLQRIDSNMQPETTESPWRRGWSDGVLTQENKLFQGFARVFFFKKKSWAICLCRYAIKNGYKVRWYQHVHSSVYSNPAKRDKKTDIIEEE